MGKPHATAIIQCAAQCGDPFSSPSVLGHLVVYRTTWSSTPCSAPSAAPTSKSSSSECTWPTKEHSHTLPYDHSELKSEVARLQQKMREKAERQKRLRSQQMENESTAES